MKIVASLLSIIYLFTTGFCRPTPPSRLARTLAFDLNELPQQVEQVAESDFIQSAVHSSVHDPVSTTGSFSAHSSFTAPHGDQWARAGPFWHHAGPSSSSMMPPEHLAGWRYAYIPAFVYHPVPVVPPHQPFQVPLAPVWPHHQSIRSEQVNLPVTGSQQSVQHYTFLGNEHLPDVALPTYQHSTAFRSDFEGSQGLHPGNLHQDQGMQSSLPGGRRNTIEAASSSGTKDAVVHAPQPSTSTDTDAHMPLLPVRKLDFRQRKFRGSQSLAAERGPRADEEDGVAQIRDLVFQDPTRFSGDNFRLSLRFDPQVSRLIKSLRTAQSMEGTSAADSDPAAQTVRQVPTDLDGFFQGYFWSRKMAKEVLLHDEGGRTRIIYIVFLNTAGTLTSKKYVSQVAAWEIGPAHQHTLRDLYFYGFYPLSVKDFENLERHPASTRRSYYFGATRRRLRQKSTTDKTLALSIIRANVGQEATNEPAIAAEMAQHPEIRPLMESGQLQRSLSSSRILHGRHVYVAQETAVESFAPMKRWLDAAALPHGSFTLIKLTPEQIDELPIISAARYRTGRHVKVISEANGEMYMLDFAPALPRLGIRGPGVMAVWKFGPEVDGAKRLLINKGHFSTYRTSFNRLTPDTVSGLRDSWFQYNMVGLP